MNDPKETNPKQALGVRKCPMSVIPPAVLREVGLALLEGACKYGAFNWRVAGVRASVYYDACVGRHLADWWEGQDVDPDSGIHEVTKAIAGLIVLRDAMINNKFEDDRPPHMPFWSWHKSATQETCEAILNKYPEPKPRFTHLGEVAKAMNKEIK